MQKKKQPVDSDPKTVQKSDLADEDPEAPIPGFGT